MNPAQKEFQEKFKAAFGAKSEMLSANAYDTLKILSNCFEKTGIEVEKVKACLYSTNNYAGASGTLSFDQYGSVSKPFIIKTVKDGKFVRLEQ